MREEEAFRADSIAALAGMTPETVLVVWAAPDGDDAPTTGEQRSGTVYRYLSRAGLCWATLPRAAAGDTLRCPWRRPSDAELDAMATDGMPVTAVYPPIDPAAIAAPTPAQHAMRLLGDLRAGRPARPDGATSTADSARAR